MPVNPINFSVVAPNADEPQAPVKKRPPALCIGLLLAAFLCGGITGGAVGASLMRRHLIETFKHPERMMAEIPQVLERKLDLSPAQTAQVQEIARRQNEAFEKLRREFHPRVSAQLEDFEREVASVLTDEQLVSWRAQMAELRKDLPPPPSR